MNNSARIIVCTAIVWLVLVPTLAQPAQQKSEQQVKIDLNQASLVELETLPGIGPRMAERIVQFRQEHGPFKRIEELMLVRGIGEKKFLQLKERVRVGTK